MTLAHARSLLGVVDPEERQEQQEQEARSESQQGRNNAQRQIRTAARATDGVAKGMQRQEHVAPDVHILPHDPRADERALHALAVWAMRLSPLVAVDLEQPDACGLLLNIQGCQRMHGGERRLLNTVANALEWMGIRARVAIAPSIGAAWAMARFGHEPRTRIEPQETREALGPLPIECLRLDNKLLEALHSLAIRTVADLRSLPRLEIAARFDAALLHRLDQALGQAPEALHAVRVSHCPVSSRIFSGPVCDTEAIRQTVRGLLDSLCTSLHTRESGVCRLDCIVERADAPDHIERLQVSHPTRDVSHLDTLLQPRLERMHMGFGVESITLQASRTARVHHHQHQRWTRGGTHGWAHAGSEDDDDSSHADAARAQGHLFDALVARFGPSNIIRWEPVASHIPEQCFRAVPWCTQGACNAPKIPGNVSETAILARRPGRLLSRPEPMEIIARAPDGMPAVMRWRGMVSELRHCDGPERISAPWWRAPISPRTTTRSNADSKGQPNARPQTNLATTQHINHDADGHRDGGSSDGRKEGNGHVGGSFNTSEIWVSAGSPVVDQPHAPTSQGMADESVTASATELDTDADAVWRQMAVRDYFTVSDQEGRWFWIFRGSETGQWWMHGQWV